MRNVLLAGAFGQANPGDEGLLEAFRHALPDYRLTALSRDPALTRTRHGCDAVHPDDRVGLLRTVRQVDAVVIAGGTIFKRLHASSGRRPGGLLWSTLALTAAARARRVPIAMVGVGAGDLSTAASQRMARAIAKRCALVVLRDEESAVILERAGVRPPFRVGADPAWVLLAARPPVASPARENRVVVALSRFASSDPAFGSFFGRAIRAAVDRTDGTLAIDLQPWQVEDAPLAESVLAQVPTARVVEPPATLTEARDQLGVARAVVGLRFHALVAAAAAGTPFVAIAHEAKLAAMARRLEQPALRPDAASIERLPDAIGDCLAGPPPAPARVHAQVAAAEEGFRLLRLLLSEGRDDDLATLVGLPLVPERWLP